MNGLATLKGLGLSLGATLMLFVGGLSIPIAGVLTLPFVPYPALVLGVKFGKRLGQAVPFVAALSIYFFAGRNVTLGYMLLGLLTLLLFAVFGRGWSLAAVVSSCALGTLLVLLLTLLAVTGSLLSLWDVAYQVINGQVLMTLTVYENMGVSGDTVEFLREHTSQITTMFLEILPSLMFFICVVVALGNLTLLSYQFPQYKSFFFSLGDIKEWKSPDHLVWIFVIPGLSLFFSLPWLLRVMAMNLVLACSVFYFFHGLAIIAYYFHYKKVPMVFRIVGYLLIVFEQFLTILVIGLGFFDLWGDFRRLKRGGINAAGDNVAGC